MRPHVTRLLVRLAALVALVTIALWPTRSGATFAAVSGAEAVVVSVGVGVADARGADQAGEPSGAPAHGDDDASFGGDAPDEDEDDAEERALPGADPPAVARRPATQDAHAHAPDLRPPVVHLEPTKPPPEG